MTDHPFECVPPERRELVRSAVASAFGQAALTALTPVGGGASGALAYRAEARGRPYLIRVETSRGPLYNPHQYACMQAAASAGIAPPLRCVDAASGVAIMDFLPQRPLQHHPGGPEGLARDLGLLVARLQATPAFPMLGDYRDIVGGLLGFVIRSQIFAPGLLDPHLAGFERIREAYPWNPARLVSSHNDPNPRNLLFDGERLWLIDWETSYRNDPLVDVAILCNELAPTRQLEDELLRSWLGRSPDRALRARLTLMRQLTRLYYGALIFSALAALPRTHPDANLRALDPAEFIAGVQSGRLRPGAPETARALGKMYLAGFLAGLGAPDLEDALVVARLG